MIGRYYKSALLFALGSLCFLLLAELVLRCLPVDSNLRMQEAKTDIRPFMLGLPDQQYTYSFGWLFTNAHSGKTNNVGVPNSRDWQFSQPSLLVMGDSYIESMMLDYQDSLQGQLEKRLAGFPVFSLGHSGANAADYLQMASFARQQLKLKALIMLVADNDFFHSSPTTDHSDPGHSWFEDGNGQIQLAFKPYSPSSSKLKALGRQFSLAFYMQRNLKFNPIQGIKNELAQSGKTMAEGTSKIANSTEADYYRPYIDFFLRELPSRSGVPISSMIFVNDCNRKELYKKWLLPSISEDSKNGIMQIFTDSARRQGATVIDMCPAMEAYVKETGQRLDFSPIDAHWNPAGHALVADAVMPVLEGIIR